MPVIKWSRHLDHHHEPQKDSEDSQTEEEKVTRKLSLQTLLKCFEDEIDGYLKEKILNPLCRTLEEDLRLSSHLHLKLDDRNPFKVGHC